MAVATPKRRKKLAKHGYINSTPSLKKRKPVLHDDSSSGDEVDGVVPLDDSSGDELEEPPVELPEEIKAEVGKYYMVRFDTKKAQVFYVGKIVTLVDDSSIEMIFYRKGADGIFRLSATEDLATVSMRILEPPMSKYPWWRPMSPTWWPMYPDLKDTWATTLDGRFCEYM
ncbi:uncharacterized protein [Watersipora subatra]|uniref:uncharacterized protein n=1 Tax=Watersipora subatra TaxID=2589382 RepID=UPI00355B9B15